ncbi:nucleotidyltransferase family protein [Mongoliitalea daihaiensis]|uniref:nucleotidyltransferase family protein n=1 Tax=Mongoliitalea daihaiensis TaxID=2782006 RepID=UPI0021D42BE2|nr:nucleotidyltransferase family protein [Mongoliitalea daihaiensis]UJP64141.1 nucleotidyltransferase family protein [Mongoliitalea daihaiensis]
MNSYGAIILAAGQSSRLGKPKQLLEYKGKKLLQHAIDAVTPIVHENFRVVLGAYTSEILTSFEPVSFPYVHNEEWPLGMATSLKTGLTSLLNQTSVEGIFLLVSDQPFVDSEIVKSLLDKHIKENKKLVASAYGHTLGVPAFIHATYFDELLGLKQDAGAKKLFYRYSSDLAQLDFPKGSFDVDTQEDFLKLIQP